MGTAGGGLLVGVDSGGAGGGGDTGGIGVDIVLDTGVTAGGWASAGLPSGGAGTGSAGTGSAGAASGVGETVVARADSAWASGTGGGEDPSASAVEHQVRAAAHTAAEAAIRPDTGNDRAGVTDHIRITCFRYPYAYQAIQNLIDFQRICAYSPERGWSGSV